VRATLFSLLLTLAVARGAAVPSVPPALADAASAQALLGDAVWSRLVRIENSGRHPWWRSSPYPATVYALVFELSGILWFYTDADGTQSLSVTTGTAAQDERDPGPLFRQIDPGFGQWSWIEAPEGSPAGTPANGCFVESVAILLQRKSAGEETLFPRLLSYYVDTVRGRLGHTILVFGTSLGLAAIDPSLPEVLRYVPADFTPDPRALSEFLRGAEVAQARFLPLPDGPPAAAGHSGGRG